MAYLKGKIEAFFERMASLYHFFKFLFWLTWLQVLGMVVAVCIMQVLYNWHLYWFLMVLSAVLFGGSMASAVLFIIFIYARLYLLDEKGGNRNE